MLAKADTEYTAWQVAALMCNSQEFLELCEWATEKLNSDELNNKLLLANDDTEHIMLHYVPLLGIIQILDRLWNWAKEQLTSKKLNKINSKQLGLGCNEGQIRGIRQTVRVC